MPSSCNARRPQEITVEPDLTPLGLSSRLEHVLERFELDLQEQQRLASDATRRLADYEARLGEAFPLQADLDGKRAEFARIEAELADSGENVRSTARPTEKIQSAPDRDLRSRRPLPDVAPQCLPRVNLRRTCQSTPVCCASAVSPRNTSGF